MPPPNSTVPKNVPPPRPKESGLTALPTGATQILGKVSRRAASEFSVFDMPALDFPQDAPQPAGLQEIKPMPSMPKLQAPVSSEGLVPIKEEVAAEQPPMLKLQAPASPEGLVPIKEEVAMEQPPPPPSQPIDSQPSDSQLSLEERLGPTGMVILGVIVIAVVFILGYLIFSH